MYAIVYMTKNCFGAAMADLVAEGVLTKTQTGIISGSFYLIYTPLQILAGIAVDRYNPERLLKFGLIGGAVANVIIFFNHNFYVMLIAWCLNAIVQFAMWPAVFKIISSQLVRSDRSRMVFLISFSSAGGLLFGYIVAAIIPSWEYNFAISSAALFALAVALHIICRCLSPHVVADRDVLTASSGAIGVPTDLPKMSTWRLFVASGLVFILPVVVIRSMLGQSLQTIPPTMLMECYPSLVTPTIGNLLNTIIILAGMCGTLLVRTVLYPRFIHNEIKGHLGFFVAALPLAAALMFVGRISMWAIIPSICILLMMMSACSLLVHYFNVYFTPYGKNGLVAGVVNAAASLGIVLQNYAMLPLADYLGWRAVTVSWFIMIALSAVCIIFAVRPAKRFHDQVRSTWRA